MPDTPHAAILINDESPLVGKRESGKQCAGMLLKLLQVEVEA
jgi:hypothetical protein